ncbi:MAG: dihydropteroate synthase [Actinomycetota bacterium]
MSPGGHEAGTKPGWQLARRYVPLNDPVIVGILNVTPDSFSDGGRYVQVDDAVAAGLGMVEQGAQVVDVGGESTRPGADPVPADVEAARVIPVVAALAKAGVVVSIDTTKSSVAEAALEAGAEIINDVSAAADPAMVRVAASAGAGLVLMHMQGDPRSMQENPQYTDVVTEVAAFLRERAEAVISAGLVPGAVIVDPGIGFGKTLSHNLALLHHLRQIREIGYPVMVGTSRKNFLGRLIKQDHPVDRDLVSAVSAGLAVERGADLIRAHNVAAAREAVTVAIAIVRWSGG